MTVGSLFSGVGGLDLFPFVWLIVNEPSVVVTLWPVWLTIGAVVHRLATRDNQ